MQFENLPWYHISFLCNQVLLSPHRQYTQICNDMNMFPSSSNYIKGSCGGQNSKNKQITYREICTNSMSVTFCSTRALINVFTIWIINSKEHRMYLLGYITPRYQLIISNINWLTITNNFVTILASKAWKVFQKTLLDLSSKTEIEGGSNWWQTPAVHLYFSSIELKTRVQSNSVFKVSYQKQSWHNSSCIQNLEEVHDN